MRFDGSAVIFAILASSFVPGLLIFALAEGRVVARTVLNILGAFLKVGLIGYLLVGVAGGQTFEARVPFLPGLPLLFKADALSLLFVALSGVLWLVTTVYAIGYLEHAPHRRRFFGFFSLCVTATVGIALSGDLLTFLVFYELLTLATYPLVVHRGSQASIDAGRRYLAYTLTAGAVLMVAVVWLWRLAGSLEFIEGGLLVSLGGAGDVGALRIIFLLLIGGFGVKAALVPLHGWLPRAMVAPAPVSALLHAVAVVKAGAFGIVRVVTDIYGIAHAKQMGLLTPLAIAAAVTIVYGSIRALREDDLKRRLAFSTVSQVSYIALGIAVATPSAVLGGIVHLVHQGVMKITLFFCAGLLAETLGLKRVSELAGVGRRMPLTMVAFSVAAFGMIGIPPTAGFVSKWYLATGAVSAGQLWVLGVLLLSTLLNAAYFLPIIRTSWFDQPSAHNGWSPRQGRLEAAAALLIPAIVTALLTLAFGLFAESPLSPLRWARLITAREL